MPSPYQSNYGVVVVTAATLAITAAGHSGQLIQSNLAATQTFTLPAATGSGNVYEVFVNITKTGDLVIQVTTTDIMAGMVTLATDIGGVVLNSSATSDTITLNGSTTGGLKGSVVRFRDSASGTWSVVGELICSGAEATPWSADVS